jgi:serine protease Do
METKRKVKSIKSKKDMDRSELEEAYQKELEEFSKNSKPKNRLVIIGAVLLGIILLMGLLSLIFNGKSGSGISPIKEKVNDSGISAAVSKIYDATVYIQNYSNGTVSTTGTGFVYKKDRSKGYILTNYHVVSGSSAIRVTLSDDTVVKASFVGGDQYADIAIITIPSKNVKQIANIGSSAKTPLGATVFTVGSPINNKYRGTVTRGILSGKDRLVKVVINGGTDYNMMKLLQTDAAISPGNSGGPLCDVNGDVIGMNSYKIVKENIQGVNFAISMDDINKKLASYEKGTSNVKPYIGIAMVNLSDSSSMAYYGLTDKVNTKRTRGVVVESVKSNSAAAQVLAVGDIIYKFNGVTVSNMDYLRYELYRYNVGDKVDLTVERDGKTRTIPIVLRAKYGN